MTSLQTRNIITPRHEILEFDKIVCPSLAFEIPVDGFAYLSAVVSPKSSSQSFKTYQIISRYFSKRRLIMSKYKWKAFEENLRAHFVGQSYMQNYHVKLI